MTASKEISRPTSQHRHSLASSVPARQSISRAHSSSLGAANATHRISRRKSSSFAPTAAAIEAAVEYAVAPGSTSTNRRSSISKALLSGLNEARPPMVGSHNGTAVTDGLALSSYGALEKHRRRASDGSRLSKKEKPAASDLKCEHCGKAYKHGSCLSKHLWEHTPQWQLTSKLLISKHQQVQLLEAASVLVGMNQDGPTDSDTSSPAASGSSDPQEDIPSSTETTPPPHQDHTYRDSKRHSNSSSVYSRSYQSIFSSGSAPQEHGFSHARQWSTSSNRPNTANTSIAESYPDEDPADLAAAVGLLSCSYRTPKSGPTILGDVPPVPPLPAKYLDSAAVHKSASRRDVQADIDMDDENSDYDQNARHDDAEYGVFGRMD
ncbi:hypothetical protein AMS68_001660 [Peltaster fructicola]|uniref:C2H2-type domain-containing protein n=1 Tax=Peltaster fructicola TaxID=286661 RepID=A0A6H0XN43_9PEZI|nr:hypothetical protein AMS68_001660 [Peltaster fructicola]